MLKNLARSSTLARSWKSIAIDVGVIIFSVLFALALDDWRQRQITNEKVEKVIATIRHEISENKTSVGNALAYHRPMVENLVNGTHLMMGVNLEENPIDLSSVSSVEQAIRRMAGNSGAMMFEEINVKQSVSGDYHAKIGDQMVRLVVRPDSMFVYGSGNIQLRPARILNSAWQTAMATQSTLYLDFELVAAMTELVQLHETHNNTVSRIIDILYGNGGSMTSALQDLRWFEEMLLEQYEKIEGILDK